MTNLPEKAEEALYKRVAEIIESARSHIAQSVNTAMVYAYWLIGREIIEVEQAGQERAGYGEKLIEQLSAQLNKRFGKGFGISTLRRIRRFYLAYPQGSNITEKTAKTPIRSAVLTEFKTTDTVVFSPLSWAHFMILIRVDNLQARSFYEIEAVRENWSTRELERQIGSLLFERLTMSKEKDAVLKLAREGQLVENPADVIKDPFILEFLELDENSSWFERDLEQAIINKLEAFLLELGKGFCFVARQQRLTIDFDHFYVDLVFYNRLLKCFVLIDLKLGKLEHQDIGQMQMYVNYFDRYKRDESEAPTVGIILCSDKNDAMVRITLPEDNKQIHASRYLLYLPTEDELRAELERQRAIAEKMLLLSDLKE